MTRDRAPRSKLPAAEQHIKEPDQILFVSTFILDKHFTLLCPIHFIRIPIVSGVYLFSHSADNFQQLTHFSHRQEEEENNFNCVHLRIEGTGPLLSK